MNCGFEFLINICFYWLLSTGLGWRVVPLSKGLPLPEASTSLKVSKADLQKPYIPKSPFSSAGQREAAELRP